MAGNTSPEECAIEIGCQNITLVKRFACFFVFFRLGVDITSEGPGHSAYCWNWSTRVIMMNIQMFKKKNPPHYCKYLNCQFVHVSFLPLPLCGCKKWREMSRQQHDENKRVISVFSFANQIFFSFCSPSCSACLGLTDLPLGWTSSQR